MKIGPPVSEAVGKAEKVTGINPYEELIYAKETVDLSSYENQLLTDNQGTRVRLFSKDNEQSYKTVYVKNNNWLKVINLEADKLLLNEKNK